MLDLSGGRRLAKVTVSIRHISWRDGRPRFEPGPTVRELGFKGGDLKHPTGEWFTLAETQTWVAQKIAEIKARREGVPIKKAVRRGVLYNRAALTMIGGGVAFLWTAFWSVFVWAVDRRDKCFKAAAVMPPAMVR